MITRDFANRFIAPPKKYRILVKKNYNTQDIINAIVSSDKEGSEKCVERFAKNLHYSSLADLGKQLFDFLYNNVRYIEDPGGSQFVKTPSELWWGGYGDCKSFSLFIGSVLKALKIPYSYRFVSYSNRPVYTHVYVIMHGPGKDYIIDVVYKKFNKDKDFNEEKKYTYKKDYRMPGLYKIGKVGQAADPTKLNFRKPMDQLSETDMELEIARQRLEIEKSIVAGLRGIGSAKVARYQTSIDNLHRFIDAHDRGDIAGMESVINGIGNSEAIGLSFLKKIANKVKSAATSVTKKVAPALKKVAKVGAKVVKTVAKTAVKAGKVVAKVVTAPLRLIAKGVLEITLPKAAPAFLYLFINDQKILDKLPKNVRDKRKKQETIANFIVNGVGMNRSHFMGIIRNSLMKEYKMSPEKKLSQLFNVDIHGIGFVLAIPMILAAIQAIQKIISLISGGKKSASMSQDDAPSETDFANLSPEQKAELSKEVKAQPGAVEPGDSLDAGGSSNSAIPSDGGAKKVKSIC